MKIILIPFVILIVLSSCNSQKKSDEVATYVYKEEVVTMSDELKRKIPDWVEEGKICYSLVVQKDEDKNPLKGKPVKAKVVQIGKDAVKMKALETVSLAHVEGCSKMSLTKGETWDEVDNDFYLTKEEAIEMLKKMNIYNNSDRFTLD